MNCSSPPQRRNGQPWEGLDYRVVVDHWNLGNVSRAELTVVGDSVVSVLGLANDRGEPPRLAAELWPTIADLFDTARAAIEEASSVVVEFHPQLGYPQHLAIDYSASVFDDEVWYSVREVELTR